MNPRRALVALGLSTSLLLTAGVSAASTAQENDEIELVPFESTLLELSGVVPAGWTDAGRGIFTRADSPTDLAFVAQQSAPVGLEQIWPAILPQLGLSEVPTVDETRSSDAFDWQIYRVDVPAPARSVSVALSEQDGRSYIAMLTSAPEEHTSLVASVFDPVVEAMAPLAVDMPVADDPVDYVVEEVTFPGGSDAVVLAGTLTLPAGDGPHPVIVLLNGSGGQDRDSSFRPLTELAPFADLADAFTSAGVGVLRYDDRGVAGSSGDYGDATVADLTEDASSALDYLVTRSDVDAGRMGLLGHSEGAVYTASLAADDPRVSFAISLAGPAVDGISAIDDQQIAILRSMELPDDYVERLVPLNSKARDEVYEGDLETAEGTLRELFGLVYDEQTEAVREALGERDGYVDFQVERALLVLDNDWVRSFLAIDPGEDWARVTIPVLALFGGKDLQVLAEQNEPALRAALEAAGNADHEIVVLPDANHLLQDAETGSLSEYGTLAPELTPELIPILVDWLTERAGVAE